MQDGRQVNTENSWWRRWKVRGNNPSINYSKETIYKKHKQSIKLKRHRQKKNDVTNRIPLQKTKNSWQILLS